MHKFLDKVVRPFGFRVIKEHQTDLVYHHSYSGGYKQYRDVQVHHNKRKLANVWADDGTLSAIATDIRDHTAGTTGICHGARNGYEVEWFRQHLPGEVIGTDISDTATQFPNMHVWDFQDENPEWEGKFDFVYTNSLDQAMEPQRALLSWAKQLRQRGRIYIEHTMAHSAQGAGEMDPFGAHPMAMPYLFFIWGRGHYRLAEIIENAEKQNNHQKVWIFVLVKDA